MQSLGSRSGRDQKCSLRGNIAVRWKLASSPPIADKYKNGLPMPHNEIKVLEEGLSDVIILLLKKLVNLICVSRLNGLQRKYITLPYMFQCVCATLSFCFVMFLINQVIQFNDGYLH